MKKFCILEQGKYPNDPLSLRKREQFKRSFCDFYRLNWHTPEDPSCDFHKSKILFSEGRTYLYDVVPKNYEYYIFIDDDTEFVSEDPAEAIFSLLTEWNPLCATFQELSNGKRVYENPLNKKVFCITDYDQQTNVYHRSFIENVFPLVCHASGGVSLFCQYLGTKLAVEKQVCFDEVVVRNTRHESETFSHPERVARSEQVVNLVWKTFNSITVAKDFPDKFRDQQSISKTYSCIPSRDPIKVSKEDLSLLINTDSPIWNSRSVLREQQLTKLYESRDKLSELEESYFKLLIWWEKNVH